MCRLVVCALPSPENVMKAKKILFITQEMVPFVPETPKSHMGRFLP